MLYLIDWRCGACGHVRHQERKVPKIDPPPEPDWRALERRARCSRCGVRGECSISVRPYRAR